MRMSVTLDSALLFEAQQALGAPTKADTIRLALAELLRQKCREQALSHGGQIDLDGDQETLAALRAQS